MLERIAKRLPETNREMFADTIFKTVTRIAKRLFKRLELRDALVHFGEDEASDEDGGSANEATVVNSKPSISVMG